MSDKVEEPCEEVPCTAAVVSLDDLLDRVLRLKLRAIRNDEAQFQTRFYLREAESLLMGHIVLSISHISVGGIDTEYVSLSYVTPDMVIDQLSAPEDDL